MTKVAFRFCVLYFGLFCLWFAQITFVFAGVLALWLPPTAVNWQMLMTDPVNIWVGRTVFGIDAALRRDSNSGDQAAIWVSILCLLIIAALGTALWSVLDRRRTDYARPAVWFTVFLRLCLGGQMLLYGFAKLIPTQMQAPPLATLVQPLGEFSPISMLWLQVGTSHPYEMTLGAVEMTAGLLLFWPRTAMLGALLSLLSMGQVFLLNMTFDVPVKILSFHLMLISIVLLTPHLRRLVDVFVRHRGVQPAQVPRLFASERANRIATAVQIGLGLWIGIGQAVLGWQAWQQYGDGRDKPELYGIWTVTDFRVADRQAPPLTTDRFRWQRIIFDKEGLVTIQWMNGDLRDAPLQFEPGQRHLTITTPLPKPDGETAPAADPAEFAEFDVTRPAPDRLDLTGTVQGRPVTMELESVDLESFPLRNRGFHWVQEYPYMR